jgi:predicted Zn-dependent peptidase
MTPDWERKRSEALRVEVAEARLPSGLRVRFLPMPGFRQKTAILGARIGSLDGAFIPPEGGEPRRAPPGLAHFLEHRLFDGPEGDAGERFAALGATSNASTGHASTLFYFSCADRFLEGLDVLLGFLDGFRVTDEAVARERKIIAEEIRGADDTPAWAGWQRLMACLYVESEARFDIGGTLESIEAIDADLLRAAYGAFYNPSNAELAIAGDLDGAALLARIARSQEKFAPRPAPGRPRPLEPARVAYRFSALPMEVPTPKVFLGFKEKAPDVSGEALAVRHVETEVALAALLDRGSDFYRGLYEAGVIDDSFQLQATLEPGIGHTVVSADTDSPDLLVRLVLERLERARREGVDPSDVRRILKSARGSVLRIFDHPETAAFALCASALRGSDALEIPDVLARVTPEGVDRRVADHFDPALHAWSLVRRRG